VADGAGGRRRAQLGGQLAVGPRRAVRDRADGGPDALLPRRPGEGERQVEVLELAGEVGGELLARRGERGVVAPPRRVGQRREARAGQRAVVVGGSSSGPSGVSRTV
jgi:hypothetical protein